MLFAFWVWWEAKKKKRIPFKQVWSAPNQSERQTDRWAGRQLGQFAFFLFIIISLFFFAKIVPVKLCVLKFYLEVSTSPSGCVLAVIALSISTALACLHLLPLVKPWQKVRGEERWGMVRERERIPPPPRVSLLVHLSLHIAPPWTPTSSLFFLLLLFTHFPSFRSL